METILQISQIYSINENNAIATERCDKFAVILKTKFFQTNKMSVHVRACVLTCLYSCVCVSCHISHCMCRLASPRTLFPAEVRCRVRERLRFPLSTYALSTQRRSIYPCDSAHTAKFGATNERENPSLSSTIVARLV